MELLYVSAVVLAFALVWRAVAIKARERGWPLLGRHLTGIAARVNEFETPGGIVSV